MTKCTLEITFPDGDTSTVTVSTSRWDLSTEDFIGHIVRPIMAGALYTEKSINECLGDV